MGLQYFNFVADNKLTLFYINQFPRAMPVYTALWNHNKNQNISWNP